MKSIVVLISDHIFAQGHLFSVVPISNLSETLKRRGYSKVPTMKVLYSVNHDSGVRQLADGQSFS